MKTILAVIATAIVCLSLHSIATPSQATQDPYKIQPILDNLDRIDIANKILPVLLTKDQTTKILFKVEECRANAKKQEKREADELKTMASEISKINDDVKKGIVPPPEFITKMNKVLDAFSNSRRGVILANGLIMKDFLKTLLNKGQINAIVKVIDTVYDEEAKAWTQATDDTKLQFFAVNIFLSENGYQFLQTMHKPGGSAADSI